MVLGSTLPTIHKAGCSEGGRHCFFIPCLDDCVFVAEFATALQRETVSEE